MSAISKELFYKSFSGVDCQQLMHPGCDSCFKSFIFNYIEGFKGTGKFHFPLFLIQLILTKKRTILSITKDDILQTIKWFVQTSIAGGAHCGLGTATICLSRNVFGEINYYCLGLLSGFMGGLSIFLEHPKQRGFPTVTFMYLSLEILFRMLEKNMCLKRTKSLETIMFMAISSALLYLLRITKNPATYLWLFTPPKYKTVKNDVQKKCTHNGSCREDIIKSGLRYFSYGVAIQWIRSLIPRIHLISKQPIETLFIKFSYIKMGLFTGLYVTIYKAINCFLCQFLGYDSPLHALPAGMVAGLTYLLKADFSVVLIALSNLIMVTEQYFKSRKIIPEWPFSSIIYAICAGFLFHIRFADPTMTPKEIYKFMDAYSNGKTARYYKRIASHLNQGRMGL